MPTHSVTRAMTGCAVARLNSVLSASASPARWRCVLDHGDLHSEADAEVRHLVLARVARRLDLPVDPAPAESARNEDRVRSVEAAGAGALDLLRVDVADLDPGTGVDPGVDQRFAERLVGFRQPHVLADHRDPHVPARVLESANDRIPFREIALLRLQPEPLDDQIVEPLLMEHAGIR